MPENFRTAPGGGKLYPYNGLWPTLGEGVFIAPGARVVGNVTIGDRSSVWFNCVLRADVAAIQIGQESNVQDGTVIHVDSGGFDTIIGDHVLIGHSCMVHGTVIMDHGFIGLGAVTMNGCVVESGGMLAAGSLLSEGKIIGARELWIGRPAKKVRDIDAETAQHMKSGAVIYCQAAAKYLEEYDG